MSLYKEKLHGTQYSIDQAVNENLTQISKSSRGWSPVLRVIFEGVYDSGSSLSTLRGAPHIIQIIWKLLTKHWQSLDKLKVEEYPSTPTAI